MKLLLDQGLPRSAVSHLAKDGISAEHVGGLGMSGATDAEILALARVEQFVVVTLDADFHRLLAASGETTPSIVLVRIEGLKGDKLAAILVQVIATAARELAAGAIVSVDRNQIRVRSLPLG